MGEQPLSLGPYHIEYNEETDRYEVVLTTSNGMEVVDDAESEEVALSQMQVQYNYDQQLGLV